MRLRQQGQTVLTALILSLILFLASALGMPSQQTRAIALSLHASEASMVLASNDTAVERRVNATVDKVTGQAQEKLGDRLDSPANRVEGRAKQLSGEARNRTEDVRDKARDAAAAVQDKGENLIDRVKDIFDGDASNTGRDTDTRITGTRRTGSY